MDKLQLEEDWQKTKYLSTTNAYKDFIIKYYNSEFSTLAKKVLEYSENGIIESYSINRAMFYTALSNSKGLNYDRLTILMDEFSPILRILSDSLSIKEFGIIDSIKTFYIPRRQEYLIKPNGLIPQEVEGESFYCEVKLEKRSSPLYKIWTTEFPSELSWHQTFVAAPINPNDLLSTIYDRIPKKVFLNIAIKEENYHFAMSIIDTLSNQELLGKIALENNNSKIRRSAIEKLSEQSILEKIAIEDKEGRNRYEAINKLTNLCVLEKIEKDEKDEFAQNAATSRIIRLQSNNQTPEIPTYIYKIQH